MKAIRAMVADDCDEVSLLTLVMLDPPYGRNSPLGPGILWVYPPNQKDCIDFFYCFNNVLHKLKIETVKGKNLDI